MDAIKSFANNLTNRDQNNNTNGKIVPLEEKDREPLSQKNPLGSMADELQMAASKGIQKLIQSVDNAKADVKQGFTQLDDKLKLMLKQYTHQINVWARSKVLSSVIIVIEKFRPTVKEGLKDPDMCQCVKNLVDDTVDATWPEIVDEVKYQLMLQIGDPYTEIEEKKQTLAFLYPFVWIRNWYLYSNYPFDRSVWRQYKTISYWFWYIVSLIPFYGVSQYFYVLDFIMIDKGDEYQLVKFILSFKTMFFITQGVMKALIGYFMLYACTTMNYIDNAYQDDCTRKGPGSSIEVFSEVIGQGVQVVLIWLAFFLLSCSKQKGKPIFQYDDTPQMIEGCFERGGRLKYFMFWDIFALGSSIGLFWLVYLTQDTRPNFDNSGDFIYFTEICYGMLSFPFLIFNVPFVNGRLTKAKATAYDRKGNCIPAIDGLRKKIKSNQEEETNLLLNTLTIDVGEVFDG
ncbi:unnamed protein product [Paramecium pentaurelia]|uniref:Uncharacterized protein n=1 Tax=Paramecium pentaurelia TaxID=43138 RepID=A0A8S1Y674_9CILI|nr:unnamed protein product [Paramecium pentaurelia]